MKIDVTPDRLDEWASNPNGPVALHLREELMPVEGDDGVFFPPTFAGIDYNIDTLADGTRVALVDSVGAQANRMEPIFLDQTYRHLVPQVWIKYEKKGSDEDSRLSLLKAGHRLGDAVVRSTELREEARAAFRALLDRNDATPIAQLNPTALVFGAWDSRDTLAKVPRIIQSVIRAWNVSELKRSAQFSPALDYAALDVFTEQERQKAEGKKGTPLAERGFVDVPATESHGGIVAHGPIRRDVTVNLVALRRLGGEDPDLVRQYVLGLALVAALAPTDPFLRQGCLLVPKDGEAGRWSVVERTGRRPEVLLELEEVFDYATERATSFGVAPERTVAFDSALAKEDVKAGDKKKQGSK